MNWRAKVMDHRDFLLLQARDVLQSVRSQLQQIMDDDDMLTISASHIGDVGDIEENGDQIMEETPEQKMRRTTFELISAATIGLGCVKTAAQVQAFCDDGLSGLESPSLRRAKILDYFWDSRRERPSLPAWPRAYYKVAVLDADTRIRAEAILTIICLIEDMQQSAGSTAKWLKTSRERYEAHLSKRESPIETIRRHAFKQASDLCGKSEKALAKVFDRIDWKALRRERFAGLHDLLFDDLPQPNWKPEPKEEKAYKKWKQENEIARIAQQNAELAQPAIERLFEALRSDIARQIAKEKQQPQAA